MGLTISILIAIGLTAVIVYLIQVYKYCEREFKHNKMDRMFLLMIWLMPIVFVSFLWDRAKKKWGIPAAKRRPRNDQHTH